MGVLIDDTKRFIEANRNDVAKLEDKFFELLEANEADPSPEYYDSATLVLGEVFKSLDQAEQQTRQRDGELDEIDDLDERQRALSQDSLIKVWNMARRQLGVGMAQGDGLPYPRSFKLMRDPGVAGTLRLVAQGKNGVNKTHERRERSENRRHVVFEGLIEDGWFHVADEKEKDPKKDLTVRPKRPVPWRHDHEPPEPLDGQLGGLPGDEQLVIRLWDGRPVGGCLFDVRTIRKTVQACGFPRHTTQKIMTRLVNPKVGDRLPTASFNLTQIGILLQLSKHDIDQILQRGQNRAKEMLARQYRVKGCVR